MPVKEFNRAEFEQNPVVADWLKTVRPSTAPSYSLSLLYYCAFTGHSPEQLIEDELEHRQRRREAILKRDTENSAKYRLQQFREWLLADHPDVVLVYQLGTQTEDSRKPFRAKTRATISRMIGSVKSFYSHQDVPVGKLGRFSRGKTPFEETITTGDIAKAVEHADIRTKALILVAATTGRSATDLLKLQVGDINREAFPGWGFIYNKDQVRQKTGVVMISWLTPEALHHVGEYLATRPKVTPERYLFTEQKNDKTRRISKDAAGQLLRRLAKSVFPKQRDNPLTLRALRSWFGTQLDHVSYDHKQILLAHSLPYGGAYSKPKREELFASVKTLYKEGYTRILTGPKEYDRETLKREFQEEAKRLQERVQELERLQEIAEDSERERVATTILAVSEATKADLPKDLETPQLDDLIRTSKEQIASIRDGKDEGDEHDE